MRQKYNKTDIIHVGVQVFQQQGYHNTGVDDILKRCGIPSGSFYNFFKNKEGFAVQALEYYNQRYLEMLDQLFAGDASPLTKIRALFTGSVNTHIEKKCSMGCLLNSMTSEVAALNMNIGKLAAEHYQRNAQKLSEIIQDGQNLGEIRKDFSALDLAYYLSDAFTGATTRMQAGQTDQPLQLFLRTAFEFIKAK